MSRYTICVCTTHTEQEITLEQEHPLLAVIESLEHLEFSSLEQVTGITIDEVERQAERCATER